MIRWIVRVVGSMICLSLIGCTGSSSQQHNGDAADAAVARPAAVVGSYLGSEYKGNYVWGGAMNLAWTELKENVVGEDIVLLTPDGETIVDKTILHMVDMFNNPVFTKDDMDDANYYIKSGYGQQTVDRINNEVKEKFPTRSFADLKMILKPTDIIAYAYFLKDIEYEEEFFQEDVDFDGSMVKGFYAGTQAQKEQIRLIEYNDDDTFVLSIQLKDNDVDQLILAKGYDMSSPEEVIDIVAATPVDTRISLGKGDQFTAPNISLDYTRTYSELKGKIVDNLKTSRSKGMISQMYEKIKFDMDSEGARVENEGVIAVAVPISTSFVPSLKSLYLDKPYRIIMKQKNSTQPYFVLGVNNTELMEVIEDKAVNTS